MEALHELEHQLLDLLAFVIVQGNSPEDAAPAPVHAALQSTISVAPNTAGAHEMSGVLRIRRQGRARHARPGVSAVICTQPGPFDGHHVARSDVQHLEVLAD